jgi:xanthine/uracil permease
MENNEVLSQIIRMLESVTRMISVLAIGQRMTEATSDIEKEYLANALCTLLGREYINVNTTMNNSYGQNNFM